MLSTKGQAAVAEFLNPSLDEAPVVKTLVSSSNPLGSKRFEPIFIDDETAYNLEREKS